MGLIHRQLAQGLNDRRTGLEVDWSPRHLTQTIPQRPERRRCERMLLTERHRMNARNMELAEQHYHVAANEGHVEVARARAVRVEWLVRSKLVSGDCASPEDHVYAIRRRVAQHAHKLIEPLRIAPESEPCYALPDFGLTAGLGSLVASLVLYQTVSDYLRAC